MYPDVSLPKIENKNKLKIIVDKFETIKRQSEAK